MAAPPTAGGYTQVVFGEGLGIRVGDGIRTRDIQIHNLVTNPRQIYLNPLSSTFCIFKSV